MNYMSKILGASLFLSAQIVMAADQPTVVLVHGAFEDAQVWGGVSKGLAADGFRVIAVDLPGRPSAPLGADKVSIALYRGTVLKAIEQERNPVVLVGHSFAGIVISAVAEAQPEKIKTLVYLAAYLPKSGESAISLANTDRDSKAGNQLLIDKEKGIASVKYEARADLFANDASATVRKALPDAMNDEPVGPLVTPVILSEVKFGNVDKTYIYTDKDQMVSPYLQHKMTAASPVRMTFNLNTGHTPFFTDVPGLVDAIERSAR